MTAWFAILYGIIGLILGIIFEIKLRKASEKIAGGLIIDKGSPDVNGGVYMVWDINPMTLQNGQIVKMEVTVADLNKVQNSQLEQGV